MANRYWVGGTAAWDGTAGTKWALTSGGAGGQAVPTASDDVFFDAASGAVTCTISAGNTGALYTFGYTGNFNINGQFALVESTSYYDGNMIIGTQYGGTGPFISVTGTAENVTVLKKNDNGSFTWAGTYYTGNKKLYSDKVLSQVLEYDAKVIDKESTSSNPTLDTYLPSSTPLLGITSPVLYTALQTVKNNSKQIQAFVPSQLGVLQSSFVTAKYS